MYTAFIIVKIIFDIYNIVLMLKNITSKYFVIERHLMFSESERNNITLYRET